MSVKAVLGVIIVAILIGVVYVSLEKNFFGGGTMSSSGSSSAQELSKEKAGQSQQEESSLINYPESDPAPAPITGSTDLLQEAEGLQMRDYSTYFDELKDTVSNQ